MTMIPLDKLRALNHLVTHANCPDGVASALILKDALPDLRVSFVKYGTEEHRSIEPAPGTIFCDFSPWLPKLTDPRAKVVCEDGRVAEVTDKGVTALRDELVKLWCEAGVVVLDHHTRDVVEPYGELGIFGENERLECGAWLAYQHVWLPLREHEQGTAWEVGTEHFARLASIRDTWRKTDPIWGQACFQAAALTFFGYERLIEIDERPAELIDSLQEIGDVVFNKQLDAARTAISEAHRFQTARGTRVLLFQGVVATTDAAEILEKGLDVHVQPDLVVGFHYRVDAGKLQLQYSTRSHTGFDCQAFARAHGGNGHRAAAGFTVEVSPEIGGNPYAVFRLLLEEWESGQ